MVYKSKIPNKALEKRIRKSGEVTDADVQEYINQVGMDTLQSMSLSAENVKEYLKNVVELGTPKKKLPKKKKIDPNDLLLVVDQSGNLSTVEQKEKLREEKIRERAKNVVEGSIDLGNKAFNKMFPGIGKLLGWVQNKLDKQARNAAETNSSIEGYSRQTDRSSKLLESIAESQSRSNNTLQQILTAVSSSRTPQQPVINSNSSGSDLLRSSIAGAAAAAAAVGAGAMALNRTNQESTPPPPPPTPEPVAAPVISQTTQPSPTSQATPVSQPTPSAINQSTSRSIFSIQAFREADPEGAAEFESFVRTRTREIEQELNGAIPRNLDRNAVNMHLDANKVRARSMAVAEARQRFAERIQRTRTQTPSPPSPAEAVGYSTVQSPATRVLRTDTTTRLLNIKAREIVFKADKIEFPQAAQTAVAPMTMGGFSSVATPSATVSTGGSTGAATPTATANLTGLEFGPGVDPRIGAGIANKTKEVQSTFGKKLLITSGFRDAGRNARAGGAEGSKHLTGEAVDVQFPGNEQDTINLIKAASQKGVGGIGVYRPGFVHLDVGSKRVWGPDYRAGSIPQWAKPALDEHMGRTTSEAATPSGGGGTSALTPIASPVASRTPSTPSSGAAISRASIADETAGRPTAPLGMASRDSAGAPISNAPQQPSATSIDPNNPGLVEPPDAAIRYARLFGMAA